MYIVFSFPLAVFRGVLHGIKFDVRPAPTRSHAPVGGGTNRGQRFGRRTIITAIVLRINLEDLKVEYWRLRPWFDFEHFDTYSSQVELELCGEPRHNLSAQFGRVLLCCFGSSSEEGFVGMITRAVLLETVCQARGVRQPSSGFLDWCGLSLAVWCRHAELAHVHGDRV